MRHPFTFSAFLLAFLIRSQFIACETPHHFTNESLPDYSFYPHSYNLTDIPIGAYATLTQNGYFSIHWSVINQFSDDATLRVLLTLSTVPNPTTDNQPWMGIGFGKSMLDASFVVCHSQPVGIEMHEHQSVDKYINPPKLIPKSESEKWVIKPISGGHVNGTFFCEFSRKVRPQNVVNSFWQPTIFAAEQKGAKQDLIWAFHPHSPIDIYQTYFSYHELNGAYDSHGSVQLDWETGRVITGTIPSMTVKQVHGIGAAIIWMLVFPFAAFYARYLRSTPGWVIVHVIIQCVGFVAFMAIAAVGIINVKLWYRTHYILGLALSGLLLVQVTLGAFNRVQLYSVDGVEKRKWIRIPHRVLGLLVLCLAIVQAFLGLNTLHPYEEKKNLGYWAIFIAVATIEVFAFMIAEGFMLYLKKPTVKPKKTNEKTKVLLEDPETKTEQPTNSVEQFKLGLVTRKEVLLKATEKKLDEGFTLQKFTWEELDQEVQKGRILVVGNGRFVYDASKWIHSHPGGQVILHTVAGTDISNDYFEEAGFDASEFTPAPEWKKQLARKAPEMDGGSRSKGRSSIGEDRYSHKSRDKHFSVSSSNGNTRESGFRRGTNPVNVQQIMTQLNEKDWNCISRARRAHKHTQIAIQRLAKLLVGEIVNESDVKDGMYFKAGQNFDHSQYQRYCVTEKKKVAKDVFMLRVANLYPYDTQDGAPTSFEPGQCVEIQVRVGGKIYSRYYTPTNGTLTVFEIYVKVYEGGIVSNFLAKQTPGDRQIKIRGPIGSHLLKPSKGLDDFTSLAVKDTTRAFSPAKQLYFIAAGSGVTPYFSLARHLFLPIAETLKVQRTFEPAADDELAASMGHIILPRFHSLDGWCVARNLTTHAEGFFPLGFTTPRFGSTSLTLINCVDSLESIFDLELFNGLLLAYPRHIQIHHVVTKLDPISPIIVPDNLAGVLHIGRLNAKLLVEIVTGVYNPPQNNIEVLTQSGNQSKVTLGTVIVDDEDDESSPDFSETSRRAFVCGPNRFQGFVVDALYHRAGFIQEDVDLLPADVEAYKNQIAVYAEEMKREAQNIVSEGTSASGSAGMSVGEEMKESLLTLSEARNSVQPERYSLAPQGASQQQLMSNPHFSQDDLNNSRPVSYQYIPTPSPLPNPYSPQIAQGIPQGPGNRMSVQQPMLSPMMSAGIPQGPGNRMSLQPAMSQPMQYHHPIGFQSMPQLVGQQQMQMGQQMMYRPQMIQLPAGSFPQGSQPIMMNGMSVSPSPPPMNVMHSPSPPPMQFQQYQVVYSQQMDNSQVPQQR